MTSTCLPFNRLSKASKLSLMMTITWAMNLQSGLKLRPVSPHTFCCSQHWYSSSQKLWQQGQCGGADWPASVDELHGLNGQHRGDDVVGVVASVGHLHQPFLAPTHKDQATLGNKQHGPNYVHILLNMWNCVYVCVYVCAHACTCMHAGVCMCACVHVLVKGSVAIHHKKMTHICSFRKHWSLQFVRLKKQSPWYNLTGWLGVNQQVTYLLLKQFFTDTWNDCRIRLSTQNYALRTASCPVNKV